MLAGFGALDKPHKLPPDLLEAFRLWSLDIQYVLFKANTYAAMVLEQVSGNKIDRRVAGRWVVLLWGWTIQC